MASSKKQLAAPRNLDKEMRQLLVEIRMLEGSARVLSSRLDIVTGALSETQTAKQTLEGTKEAGKDVEMLIPIGSGSFVKAKLEDPQHIIIGVGAGGWLEKNRGELIKDIKKKANQLGKGPINANQPPDHILQPNRR